MYSQDIIGTTSTFFWWKDGGQDCGNQWNELDIEMIPAKDQYQSNPIWQTSDADCEIETWEDLHGDVSLYGRWVDYTLEWSPTHVAWYHDGQLDRRIELNDEKLAVNYITHAMKYCFNLWTQGTANPAWLGDLDFNALQNQPVFQFVDHFKFYDWNGSSFNANPTTTIDFSSADDIHLNFNVSSWEFGQSQGFLSWSENAVGVVDLGDGNSALWLGLFHNGQERAPVGNEIPGSNIIVSPPVISEGGVIKIEAESAAQFDSLEVAADQIGYISDGAWASYAAVNIPSAGQYLITYQVAGAGDGGTIQLEQAGGGTVFGSVVVPVTGEWTNWTSVSHTVSLPAGDLSIGLVFADGGFNFESFTLSPIDQVIEEPAVFETNIQAESTIESTGLVVSADSLGYIENGSWAKYPAIIIPSAGDYIVTYQIASELNGGVIQFEQAGGGVNFGSINIPSTGGWVNWAPISQTVSLPSGELNLALAFTTGGFNIESFTIKSAN
jgi:hypothetical protein